RPLAVDLLQLRALRLAFAPKSTREISGLIFNRRTFLRKKQGCKWEGAGAKNYHTEFRRIPACETRGRIRYAGTGIGNWGSELAVAGLSR
ncbi:MAG: hypothetical protein R6U29_05600, partial [Desulfosudaceae bacterium]